jgi:hypothetical protein
VIVALPAATPLATPLEEPIVATDVLLLTHVPPVAELLSVDEAPAQNASVPVMLPIDEGVAFTVTIAAVLAVPQAEVTV